MTTTVIEPPEPIVSAEDLPETRLSGSALDAVIMAAQESIDGPTGWVGRCFGVQTVESVIDGDPSRWVLLPYPPVIEVLSMRMLGGGSVSFQISDDADRRVKVGHGGKIIVRYRAGYSPDENTGPMPERARQAIIFAATHMANLDLSNTELRTETVEGIGSTTYTVSTAAQDYVDAVNRSLLRSLMVIRP